MRAAPFGSEPPSECLEMYVPYLARQAPVWEPPPRVWGAQFPLDSDPAVHSENVAIELPRFHGLGLRAVRTYLRWDRVEPANTTPDAFDWREPDRLLADYAAAGYDVLVTLVSYPPWATRYRCGYEMLPGMEREWREFVREVARRYGRAPYRLAAIEIGNEPDGKTFVSPVDYERPPEWGQGEPTVPHGGCWGDRPAAYAEFLRAAYEEAKAFSPTTVVTQGGLAYADLQGTFHMDFLEGLLAAGGGEHFDVLSYHWFADVGGQALNGPQKLRSLIETLARHGAPKPIWLTETYRLLYTTEPYEQQPAQVQGLTRDLVELLAFPELQRVYWYGPVDYPPSYRWRPDLPHRGLVTHDHRPRAALPVLPYVVTSTAGMPGDISTDRVEATRFTRTGAPHEYIVAWSRDGRPQTLVVPAIRDAASASVRTFPFEMLRGGDCCPFEVVPATAGEYRFTVGADSAFIEIPAK